MPITTPPSPQSISRYASVAESQFQAGPRAAVQREHRAPVAWKCRADGRVCGFSQFSHSGRTVEPERRIAGCLRRRRPWIHLGLRLRRRSIRAQVGRADLPFALTIANNNDVGNAHYDSLQIKAETKSSASWTLCPARLHVVSHVRLGYARWSWHVPGRDYFPLAGDCKADWGLSQLNLNDSFTASVSYDLPFGKGKQFGSNWNGATNAYSGIGK